MSKNKRPGKKYRPRDVLLDPMGHVKWKMTLPGSKSDSVLVATHEALAALVRGEGTVNDWNVAGDALNVTKALDRQCYRRTYESTIETAMRAHALCGARKLEGDPFGYTPEQLQEVNEALALHQAMLRAATHGELESAFALVERLRKTEPINPRDLLTG